MLLAERRLSGQRKHGDIFLTYEKRNVLYNDSSANNRANVSKVKLRTFKALQDVGPRGQRKTVIPYMH